MLNIEIAKLDYKTKLERERMQEREEIEKLKARVPEEMPIGTVTSFKIKVSFGYCHFFIFILFYFDISLFLFRFHSFSPSFSLFLFLPSHCIITKSFLVGWYMPKSIFFKRFQAFVKVVF